MNDVILIVLKVGIIFISLFLSIGYIYKKGKIFKEIIESCALILTIWNFYFIINADSWIDILKCFFIFIVSSTFLFELFEKKDN